MRSRRFLWKGTRYAMAIAAVAVAIVVRRAFDPLIGELFPFGTLFLAILFSAWEGGFGPALAATVVGDVLAVRFLFPWHGSLDIDSEHQVGLILYSVVGCGIAFVAEAMRSSAARAEKLALDSVRREEQT